MGGDLLPEGVIRYRIYRKPIPSSVFKQVAVTSDTWYIFTNFPEGCYRIYATAFRTDYNIESDPSNRKDICVGRAHSSPPSAPTNIKAENTYG